VGEGALLINKMRRVAKNEPSRAVKGWNEQLGQKQRTQMQLILRTTLLATLFDLSLIVNTAL